MPTERGEQRPAGSVPEPHCAVMTPRDKARAIRRKPDRVDPVLVPREGGEQRPAGSIPDPHRVVITPRDKARAIRRKPDREYRAPMPTERGEQRPVLRAQHARFQRRAQLGQGYVKVGRKPRGLVPTRILEHVAPQPARMGQISAMQQRTREAETCQIVSAKIHAAQIGTAPASCRVKAAGARQGHEAFTLLIHNARKAFTRSILDHVLSSCSATIAPLAISA